MNDFLDREPYSIRHGPEEDGWHHFYWIVREEPPLELAVIYADMIANLRSSLDYIVHQLVLLAGGTPTKQHVFPVTRDRANWAGDCGRALKGLHPVWGAKIEGLQPFHSAEPDLHFLAILDSVNNVLKHRLLPLAVMAPGKVWFQFIFPEDEPESQNTWYFSDAAIADGREFYRCQFVPPVTYAVEFPREPSIQISFPHDQDPSWVWLDMIEWVRHAIAVFEPAFGISRPQE